MERDPRTTRQTEDIDAEAVEVEDMDTSGHGDVLQDAVNRVADPDAKRPDDKPGLQRVEEEDMDTSGHGDPLRDNIKRP